ncbi:hypothetical protein H7F15_06985 [Pontibacter sp. Tf4]|nr:hypothetical protein [Pontibacter sp. Tf4]MBB6610777.1 hypothetical protein [Pontibacter sp. Tf4]
MMIANYFLSKKVKDLIFLEERDYTDTLSVAEENRLIIVDDFWGQNFSPQVKSHSNFQREFQRIIGSIANTKNRYLILTSRDYVIRDVLRGAEPETENLLDTNKHIINIKDLSSEDKVKILLNHLLFYDFDLSYFHRAQYDDTFEYIIMHRNYSPRHLDFFIKSYLNGDYQSSYTFYESLYKYLDNPRAFWNEVFQKLNPTAKAILLILLVSGDPMGIEDLKASFNDIQIKAREILYEAIIPGDFYKELKKLEELYISINQDEYYYGTTIKFQSPGIKDYLLEFLRHDGYLWIHAIILKARFFNQLTLVFGTKEEKIDDYDSDIPLYGQKILLSLDLKRLLKQKLLSEFKELSFCNHEEKELTDQLTRYHSNDETEYFKLITLNHLFPIERDENKDIRNFMLESVLADIKSYDDNRHVVAHRSMIYFPSVVRLLLPYLETSPNDIIQIYYESITFATEYRYFYKFKEIYPVAFQKFYVNNIQRIRKHIKELIFDEIEYYLEQDEEEIGIELDSLLMGGIEELRTQYSFRLTERYLKELETTFELDLTSLRKENKSRKKTRYPASKFEQKEKEYKPKPYAAIIEEYLPAEEVDYQPIRFLTTHGYTELLKNLKSNKSALSSLKDEKEIFESICHFIVENKVTIRYLDTYQLIETFFNYHCVRINVQAELFVKAAYKIIEGLEQSNHYSATKSRVVKAFKEAGTQKIRIEDLKPILIPYNTWYRFGHSDIITYIIAKYIDCFGGDESSELVTKSLYIPYDHRILQFLQSANATKFWEFYIIPELEKLIGSINFTDQQTILLSFIDFFSIKFELAWKKKEKSFEFSSGSNSESHYENILHFCGIEFYISDFENYFVEDYQHGDNITKLSVNTNVLRRLYERVINTVPRRTSRYTSNGDPVTVFNIILYDFLKAEENYIIAEDIGMVSYVQGTIQAIRSIIENNKVLPTKHKRF